MELFKTLIIGSIAFSSCTHSTIDDSFLSNSYVQLESTGKTTPSQILYMALDEDLSKTLDRYIEYDQEDYELLQNICHLAIDRGFHESNASIQSSLRAARAIKSPRYLTQIEKCFKTENKGFELMAIDAVSTLSIEDQTPLLLQAAKSRHLETRFNAIIQLGKNQNPKTLSYVNSLFNSLPEFIIPKLLPLLTLMPNDVCLEYLKGYLNHSNPQIRQHAIIQAAQTNRDELLDVLRTRAHYLDPIEQEAICYALFTFSDYSSTTVLKELTNSNTEGVSLSALRALSSFQNQEAKDKIFKLSEKKNPYAILLLQGQDEEVELLETLLYDQDQSIRLNAALSLQQVGCFKGSEYLYSQLYQTPDEIAVTAHSTPAGTLTKIQTSSQPLPSQQKDPQQYFQSLRIHQAILSKMLTTSEETFLKTAMSILSSNRLDLIDLVFAIIKESPNKDLLSLIKEAQNAIGNPYLRVKSTLTLHQLDVETESIDGLVKWLKDNHDIRFFSSKGVKDKTMFPFELSFSKASELYFDILKELIEKHPKIAIETLIGLLKNAPAQNRPLLAAYLILAAS